MSHCVLQPVFNPFTGRLDLINSAAGGSGDVTHAAEVLAKGSVSSVGPNTKTTIVTLAASLSVQFITKIVMSGHVYAKFFMAVSTVDESIKRGGPARTLEWNFTNPFKVEIGDVVDIKVEHFVAGDSVGFDATIFGFV